MFIAKNLELHFGNQVILDNVSFNINSNQRIGLVGRNGSGKTTLLKIIAGFQDLDSGEIVIQKDKKVAYLPQNVVLLSNKTILNEALNIFDNLGNLVEEFYLLEKDISYNINNI
ncbi:ATP-binding cassette domain-containing protein, partial [Candidatus Dependentiae bacterium]|nr:ATP-binding cassette domain-containing protein [Candidatus Dependentiae bacterium]